MNLHHVDRWCELVGTRQIRLSEQVDATNLVSIEIAQSILIDGGHIS